MCIKLIKLVTLYRCWRYEIQCSGVSNLFAVVCILLRMRICFRISLCIHDLSRFLTITVLLHIDILASCIKVSVKLCSHSIKLTRSPMNGVRQRDQMT